MKKIDLIIDALLVAESSVWSSKIAEALAAARELKALKPVAWIYNGQIHHFDPTGWALNAPTIRPLYLLEDDK